MHLYLAVFVALQATIYLKFALSTMQDATSNVNQYENGISLLDFFFESLYINLLINSETL